MPGLTELLIVKTSTVEVDLSKQKIDIKNFSIFLQTIKIQALWEEHPQTIVPAKKKLTRTLLQCTDNT